MAREPKAQKADRFGRILDRLAEAIPQARIALDYADELQLLVAVMLSAQTTDAGVNRVTPALFARFRTAADYAAATEEDLQAYLKTLGLFRTKARNLRACMEELLRSHDGRLPRDREALRSLPGVGWKTAGVVALHAFGTPAFPVDTHVGRVSRRLGLTRATDPDAVEEALTALLPPDRWGPGHQLLIWHGRGACDALRPDCGGCPVAAECPSAGRAAKTGGQGASRRAKGPEVAGRGVDAQSGPGPAASRGERRKR
jgi:endonuclease-3